MRSEPQKTKAEEEEEEVSRVWPRLIDSVTYVAAAAVERCFANQINKWRRWRPDAANRWGSSGTHRDKRPRRIEAQQSVPFPHNFALRGRADVTDADGRRMIHCRKTARGGEKGEKTAAARSLPPPSQSIRRSRFKEHADCQDTTHSLAGEGERGGGKVFRPCSSSILTLSRYLGQPWLHDLIFYNTFLESSCVAFQENWGS